jgi:phage protein D
MSLSLYSVDGIAETRPHLNVYVNGELISDALRMRLVEASVSLNRKKRPKADIIFAFEALQVFDTASYDFDSSNSADAITELLPLDSKIVIRLGYEAQFKKFGPFDVVKHDITFNGGGVSCHVFLEGFGIAKHASDYRVYSTGTIFDLFREVANRNDINLSDTEVNKGIARFKESIKNVANQISSSSQEDQTETAFKSKGFSNLLHIDPDDPFVQVGESDEDFMRRLAEYYGMSLQFAEDVDGMSFITLFHADTEAEIALVYGDHTANVSSIGFTTSKTKTSLVRQRTKPDTLQKNVPKKGKQKNVAEPIEEQDGATKSEPTREGGRNTDIFSEASKSENSDVIDTSDKEPGSNEKASSKDSTTTKDSETNRKLGKVIGRRRRAGRVLKSKVKLISGSVVPKPSMPVSLECQSLYYSGVYVVDTVEHTIDDTGFSTTLGLVRPTPKKKKNDNRDQANQTSKEEDKSKKDPQNDSQVEPVVTDPEADIFGSQGLSAGSKSTVLDTTGKATR